MAKIVIGEDGVVDQQEIDFRISPCCWFINRVSCDTNDICAKFLEGDPKMRFTHWSRKQF